MFNIHREEIEWGGRKLVLETGRMARQADGAVVATYGETVVLATGGFSVRLARERGLLVRSNPWSAGDGLDFAPAQGAATAGDLWKILCWMISGVGGA